MCYAEMHTSHAKIALDVAPQHVVQLGRQPKEHTYAASEDGREVQGYDG